MIIFNPHPFPTHLNIPQDVIDQYDALTNQPVIIYRAVHTPDQTVFYIQHRDNPDLKGVATKEELVLCH